MMVTGKIDRPIVILGCNRSGTTLLFRNLSAHPDAWSLYVESRDLLYRRFPLDPDLGDRVDGLPSRAVGRDLQREFYELAHNKEYFRDGFLLGWVPPIVFQRQLGWLYKPEVIRLVEKTPNNCFRIPLLDDLFPQARYVFLVRRAEAVVSSLMEGWKHWTGVGPDEEWSYSSWHYLAPPGWREMTEAPLEEICAFQWVESNRTALRDLRERVPDRHIVVRHEDLLADPQEEYQEIRKFCQLRPSRHFRRVVGRIEKRVFTTGGSPPEPEKWKRLNREEIERVRPVFQPLLSELYSDAASSDTP